MQEGSEPALLILSVKNPPLTGGKLNSETSRLTYQTLSNIVAIP